MPENETSTTRPKAKNRRFEGFIHQKIDPNLQKALSFLAQNWGIAESEVPTRAIMESATREALTREVQELSTSPKSRKHKVPQGVTSELQRLKVDNEALHVKLSDLHVQLSKLQKSHQKMRELAEKLCIEVAAQTSK
jgi:hypothetical protein